MSWGAAALIGSALLGAYSQKKNRDAQKEQEASMRKQRAAEQRYSPWTGRAQTPLGSEPTAQPLFGAMQGAFSGASTWQNYKTMEKQQKLIDAMANDLNAKNNISQTGQQQQPNNVITNQITNDALLGKTTYNPWGGQQSMNQLGGPAYK